MRTRLDILGWAFLSVLLFLVVWLTSTARPWLYGYPLSTLEDLCQGAGLSELQNPTTTATLLGQLSSTPLGAATLFQCLCGLGAVLLIFIFLRDQWSHLACRTVFVGALFMSSATSWIEATEPGLSLSHALQAACLTSLLAGSIPTLAAWTIALSIFDPTAGLMHFVTLVYLGYSERDNSPLWLSGLSTFLTGSVVLLTSPGNLSVGTGGLTTWAALPLLCLYFSSQVRQKRRPIYLTLLVSSALTNQAELASAIALADIFSLLLEQKSMENRPRIGKNLIHLACLSLFVVVILPGEQYLNRKILIPAQKNHLPLGKLFVPLSTERHLQELERPDRRAKVPFPEFQHADVEAARLLKGHQQPTFSVLTFDDLPESRQVSLLYALASRKRLDGWVNGESLDSAFLTCKFFQKNLLLDGPLLILRRPGQSELSPKPEPHSTQESQPDLNLKALVPIPGVVQTLTEQAGAEVNLKTDFGDYRLSFPDSPAKLILSYQESKVAVSDPSAGKPSRQLLITPLKLGLKLDQAERILPSRSLIDLKFSLSNKGQTAISSRLFQNIRIDNDSPSSFGPYTQRLDREFVLFPGEVVPLTLGVSTPAMQGKFELNISLLTLDGSRITLDFDEPAGLRARLRLPSVRDWKEEP